jgi:thioredoxin-dependent peroxiredoxin
MAESAPHHYLHMKDDQIMDLMIGEMQPKGCPMTISTMPNEGDQAPDFSLPTDGGAPISIASAAGRMLVLYFYPKDDTSGCTREAMEFNALRGEFDAAGAMIVGVSPDSPKTHAKFRKKYDLAIPLASDETKSMLQAYGVWVEKSMYGRKYMGVERTTFLIDAKGKIIRVWRKVSVPDHAADVLQAIKLR